MANTFQASEIKNILDMIVNKNLKIGLEISHPGNGQDEFSIHIKNMRVEKLSDILLWKPDA